MGKRVLFIHPDLGIGGAERLVVDAAVALKSRGYDVSFVTTHHDPTHCFEETKDGSFKITVVGDWLPRNIFGRFYALCAYIRMIFAALYVVLFSNINPDVIFCDIISVCIPVLRMTKSGIIFYCHFPDQLLSIPEGKLKDLYRSPLNWLEEKTTGSADIILVNSDFTRNVFKRTFKSIEAVPQILHPSLNSDFFKQSIPTDLTDDIIIGDNLSPENYVFLSINRYERKKNIVLAIKSFSKLKGKLNESDWNRALLLIAGGFDSRVSENIEHFEELKEEAKRCHILDKVYFFKSPTDIVKLGLLKRCDCLLYTPSNEHFGIVPLEAMYMGKPVIALNSGGPTETVVNEETGFLCNPNEDEFSAAMIKCLQSKDLSQKMGVAGRKRFQEKFSFEAFGEQLNNIVENLHNSNPEYKSD